MLPSLVVFLLPSSVASEVPSTCQTFVLANDTGVGYTELEISMGHAVPSVGNGYSFVTLNAGLRVAFLRLFVINESPAVPIIEQQIDITGLAEQWHLLFRVVVIRDLQQHVRDAVYWRPKSFWSLYFCVLLDRLIWPEVVHCAHNVVTIHPLLFMCFSDMVHYSLPSSPGSPSSSLL